jgi:cyclopropane fatty-acyl-phospholipid synthase-like methyltransferase
MVRLARRVAINGCGSQPNIGTMDVPPPIDFLQPETALAWANAANLKRPWRAHFFGAIVEKLRSVARPACSVLELGSGPGYLAEVVMQALPHVHYTLLDFSEPMHDLARTRLRHFAHVRFENRDFRSAEWAADLGLFDAIVTVQAVHELRHKDRVGRLHEAVKTLLRADGQYLVCDHVLGPGGMTDDQLYMTVVEQADALKEAGFPDVALVLEKGGLVLHRARALGEMS